MWLLTCVQYIMNSQSHIRISCGHTWHGYIGENISSPMKFLCGRFEKVRIHPNVKFFDWERVRIHPQAPCLCIVCGAPAEQLGTANSVRSFLLTNCKVTASLVRKVLSRFIDSLSLVGVRNSFSFSENQILSIIKKPRLVLKSSSVFPIPITY